MQSMAMIGPSSWRNSTLKEIKLSQSVVNRSDQANRSGRANDPLPSLRETVAELSNEEAHRYFRQVRRTQTMTRCEVLVF